MRKKLKSEIVKNKQNLKVKKKIWIHVISSKKEKCALILLRGKNNVDYSGLDF